MSHNRVFIIREKCFVVEFLYLLILFLGERRAYQHSEGLYFPISKGFKT